MTSESEAEYLDRAERAAEQIGDERELVEWDATWSNSFEYLLLSQNGKDRIEGLYQRHDRRFKQGAEA